MVSRRYLATLGLSLSLIVGSTHAANDGRIDSELRAALLQAVNAADSSFQDRYIAEVWLADYGQRLARYIPDAEERIKLLKSLHREAARAKVEPELVLAIIQIESAFDRYAISSAGALGLMQVMPFWIKELGRPDDNLLDADTNLRYGCTILRHYLDKEKGNLFRALGRYNGKINNNPYQGKVLKALDKRWFRQ